MALLRRYSLYTVLTIGLFYFLYCLSFPYENPDPPAVVGNHDKNDNHENQERTQKYQSFDWTKVPFKHRIESFTPLPSGKPKALPKIQFKFGEEDAAAKKIREARREDVKKQFLKCWRNYRTYAWMHDEIHPISGQVSNSYGGWATTLIDALDTLYIMGFEDEFSTAIKDIEMIDFGYTDQEIINVFETNIRHLGGLLAAYELSGEKRLLNKAKEVGEMLYHAFDTPNHIPATRWQFRAAGEGKPQEPEEHMLLAEIGSMTLEFTRLSQLTGDPKWYDAVDRITRLLEEQQDQTKLPGMWPIILNGRTANFTEDYHFGLGSMADSTYEYLGKEYILLGGQEPIYHKMYEKSMNAAIENTLFRPSNPQNVDMLMSGIVMADGTRKELDPVMEHLACYTGGMFALGGKVFENEEHVDIGRKLAGACVWGYKASPSGIMPEVSRLLPCANLTTCEWDENAWHEGVMSRRTGEEKGQDTLRNIASLRLPDGFTSIDDRRYLLRPEAIESVFIMHRLTGEQQWQAAAWDMWTAIMRATDTDIGNSALTDVSADSPPREDRMEVCKKSLKK